MNKSYLKWFQLFVTILMTGNAISEEASTDENVLLESLDYAAHYEIMINAPPKDVWPYVFDLELWLPSKVVHIEGEKNKPGELKQITPPEGKPFYLKILNVIPLKQYSEKYGVNSDGVGPGTYGHFGLTDLDGKTKLNLNIFTQVSIAPTAKENIDDLRIEYVNKYLGSVEEHMLHLKNLVERGK